MDEMIATIARAAAAARGPTGRLLVDDYRHAERVLDLGDEAVVLELDAAKALALEGDEALDLFHDTLRRALWRANEEAERARELGQPPEDA